MTLIKNISQFEINILKWLRSGNSIQKGKKLEYLTYNLLQSNNTLVKHTGKSGDGGIDMLLYENYNWIAIQCKNIKSIIPSHNVRELNGIFYSTLPLINQPPDQVWLITTGYISNKQQKWLYNTNRNIKYLNSSWILSKSNEHKYRINKLIEKFND